MAGMMNRNQQSGQTAGPQKAGSDDSGRDALTGLVGQDAARRRLERWLGQGPVHAALLVLPRLDAINLAYGTAAGDAVLAEVAARLVHFAGHDLDGQWFAARLGGGSFLLAAREACSRERWALLADGLADAVSRPISGGPISGGNIPGKKPTLRLSPRVALLRALPGEDAESVLDRLGQARAKLEQRSGKRMQWADGAVTRPGQSAARLEADLLRAIDNDEIEILFQPQFGLPDDRLTGAEALARWQHPRLGRIGAGALFSVAERAEYVAPLSRHIAAKALALAACWPGGLRLSLNVTPADLAAESYAAALAGIIDASGFAPNRLTLEVTEQAMLADIALARQTLLALSAKGIRIALDDFGAGFCNFRYLKLLPLDYLKLDRTMVDGVAEDARDLAVLRGIVAMAGALDLKVIAEGIEDKAQLALVSAEGCHAYQGFLRAEPMDAAAFLELAAKAEI